MAQESRIGMINQWSPGADNTMDAAMMAPIQMMPWATTCVRLALGSEYVFIMFHFKGSA